MPVREPIMTTLAAWAREMMDVAAREAAAFISRRSAATIVLFSSIVLHHYLLGIIVYQRDVLRDDHGWRKLPRGYCFLGTDLTGASSVTFSGTPAAFTVVSPSEITTTVPAGATTGTVEVNTPNGTVSSDLPFHVL
jgi:hypothetical protein